MYHLKTLVRAQTFTPDLFSDNPDHHGQHQRLGFVKFPTELSALGGYHGYPLPCAVANLQGGAMCRGDFLGFVPPGARERWHLERQDARVPHRVQAPHRGVLGVRGARALASSTVAPSAIHPPHFFIFRMM